MQQKAPCYTSGFPKCDVYYKITNHQKHINVSDLIHFESFWINLAVIPLSGESFAFIVTHFNLVFKVWNLYFSSRLLHVSSKDKGNTYNICWNKNIYDQSKQ